MKYQKERCLQCDRLRRPTDLESKYNGDLGLGTLDATGQFCQTEYWFCSDKCYEEAFSKYLDQEYLLKYSVEPDNPIAPKLNKALDGLDRRYREKYGQINDYLLQQIKPELVADFRALVRQWQYEQECAVKEARLELKERVESEYWDRFYRDIDKFLAEDDKQQEVLDKFLADIEAKDRLEEERLEQFKARPIPEETRFSGCWIVAPPGRGKTTLLHSMIMEDLKKDASIIVMDSKGDLINPIRELAALADRLVIIDPHNPIALNPLDVPKTNVRKAVGHLEYIFSALLEAKITPKQQALFRSVLRALVIGFDNPTLELFRDIISNGVKKYKEQIARLPPDLQDFFNKEFDRDYDATRNELIWRLRLLMENDFIRTMLNAPITKLNLGREMDQGKVIIINNSQALLDKDGAEFFGRFFISQLWTAATARSLQREKKPVYVYIDECQTVIRRDEMIASIIDECRSQKIALILAHQRTEQIESANVLSALSNCAIRMSNSDEEARALAPKLRTEPEHLQSLKRGRFAVFVRDLVTHAFTLDVTPVDFSNYQKMSPQQMARIMETMGRRYGHGPDDATPRDLQVDDGPYRAATPAEREDSPESSVRPTRQPPPPSSPIARPADPHTGPHTDPASKWGDS